MAEPNRAAWVSLLALKLGRDADEWLAERRRYRQSLRSIAAEVSDLTGHRVNRETVRQRLLSTEHDSSAKAS